MILIKNIVLIILVITTFSQPPKKITVYLIGDSTMIRAMMVGLDGTGSSKAGLSLAIRWAKRHDAMVVGLAVVRPPVVGAPGLPVLPVEAPAPVDGAPAPPVACPVTHTGISKPTAAAAVIALTQTFEAIPPPWN